MAKKMRKTDFTEVIEHLRLLRELVERPRKSAG